MKNSRDNNGFVLIASILLVLFLGILLGTAISRSDMQLKESLARLSSQKAFYAAETGLQKAIYGIRRNPQWRPGQAGQPAIIDEPLRVGNDDVSEILGYYSIEIQDAPVYQTFDSVWVKTIGKDPGAPASQITRSVLARVIIENPAAFFVSTMGDLHINSGSTFDSDVLGKDIFFDVNDALNPPNLRWITVNGDIFYLSNVYGADDPYVNITGESINSPLITFAGVDIDRYRTIAQDNGRYEAGDFSWNDDINIAGVGSANGLVFAEGDIHISGEIQDSMLFVAGGNVYINGDIVSSDPNPATAPQLGLLAKKDVLIPASAPADINIEAFIMADGDTGSLGGVFLAEGPKNTKNIINFNGAMALRGQNVRTAADLNVYQIRNYTYNLQLRQNRKIPFLPFIANIVYWEEINPQEPIPE